VKRLSRKPDLMRTTTSDSRMGVIFDLDGVLVDSAWAHKQAWYDLAHKENLRMTDEFFHDTFGMQNYQIIPMLVGQNVSAEEVDRMGDWKEQRYRQLIADKLFLADGVEPLLNDLRSKGFLVAIGSSAPRANLDLLLDRLHARRYFDVCVTKEDVRESKPSPQTFLKAAEKLGLPPNRCVVVEDAIPGVEAGKSAGMSIVAVTTSRKREELAKADIIVDSLSELNAEDFLKLLA